MSDAEAETRRLGDKFKAAITKTIRDATDLAHREIRADTDAALGKNIGRSWAKKHYPEGRDSFRAGGLIYSRAPIIARAFNEGVDVKPKNSKYLALPTGFNRQYGWRKGEAKISPGQMINLGGFLRPTRGGNFVWMLPVYAASDSRRRAITFAGGVRQVGRAGKRSRDIMQARAVPMFILTKKVTLKKLLYSQEIFEKWQSRVLKMINQNLRDGGF